MPIPDNSVKEPLVSSETVHSHQGRVNIKEHGSFGFGFGFLWVSGSLSRQAKIVPKNREKLRNFMFKDSRLRGVVLNVLYWGLKRQM
jgi:hypothetical protein